MAEWTNDPPTRRGWYWMREGGTLQCVEINYVTSRAFGNPRLAMRATTVRGQDWHYLRVRCPAHAREWWPIPIAPPLPADARGEKEA